VVVCGQALLQDAPDGVLELLGNGRVAVGLDEALDTPAAQAGRQAAVVLDAAVRGVGIEGGSDEHEARHALGMVEREADQRVRAHGGPGEHCAVHAPFAHDGEQVVRQRLVVVRRAGRRVAVAARVVGDDSVPVAFERLRAHHDVAARGGQAVQEHHGHALPGLLAREHHSVRGSHG
jgi:hypothetical protein